MVESPVEARDLTCVLKIPRGTGSSSWGSDKSCFERESRSKRLRIWAIRRWPAAIASKALGHVGERRGNSFKSNIGSRSDRGRLEEWNVSPLTKRKFDGSERGDESLESEGGGRLSTRRRG